MSSVFHHAIPTHSLAASRAFYGGLLGFAEGRSTDKWIDFNFYGHQFVVHMVGEDYTCRDFYGMVAELEVPVPHFGTILPIPDFHALADRVRASCDVQFLVKPTLRYPGLPGEQWTMFFKDPSGNNLEFKGMATTDHLFTKHA